MGSTSELTPAMRQYMQTKQGLPADTILMFRMGDFYELFFEDAKIASPLMDVVLTSRGGVPMCGVPYHAIKTYVSRVLEGGKKVAIAEQMEDPKTAKGLVKRDIIQVITPGTVLEDDLLQSNKSNFLVSLYPQKDRFGLSLLDLSTGDFRVTEVRGENALETELNRIQPSECLVPSSFMSSIRDGSLAELPRSITWTEGEDWTFDYQVARDVLCRHFDVASLDGFGCRGMDLAISAGGAILHYACNNLRRDASHITSLSFYQTDDCLVIDRISQRNLELVEPIFADGKGNTLVSVLDKTETPMGTRMLREWILRPLRSKAEIDARLDAVEDLISNPMMLAELRELLRAVRDLERVVTRMNLGSGNARDMLVLSRGLSEFPGIRSVLSGSQSRLLSELRERIEELPDLTELISGAIVEEPPIAIKDGGIFRDGYNDQLDAYRKAATEGKDWIANYQASEIERTGIKSLKVRFNKVFGYFIEVTKANLDMVPPEYLRKQTIVNGERFITPELKEIEDKVLGSDEKAKALEYELFQELRGTVCQRTVSIQGSARALAAVDCLASLAEVSCARQYVRPEIVEEPVLTIRDGRHPVLDARMVDEPFVPNDVNLDARQAQLALITGPNMAGKSTYIRQVALLAIMAQMGSFIPASYAKIGLTDRVFTRVGAADDISRGQSTFMVEMVETANILNNATPSSLIILDEIGRGTSTFDGLSLAWAVAEHLHDTPSVKARTLFATHYHELTDLAVTKSGVRNYNVLVKEQGEKITFVRKIVPGCADKSYGIHVARLAGLPRSIIRRASEVLANLESNELDVEGMPKLALPRRRKKAEDDPNQLTLF